MNMKLWWAVICKMVLSEKLSYFSTLTWASAFVLTFDTCSLKVTFMSTLTINHLTKASFSNVVCCSINLGFGSGLVLLS